MTPREHNVPPVRPPVRPTVRRRRRYEPTPLLIVCAIAVVILIVLAAVLIHHFAKPNEPTSEDLPPYTMEPIENGAQTGSTPPEPTDPTPEIPVSATPLELNVLAGQCFVYDVNNNVFLYKKGEGDVIYPASTTKLFTALYALTLLDPNEIIMPTDELSMVGEFSSIAFIQAHHRLTVEMLIEGMLLPSGNDAAHVLAAAAGRKLSGNSAMSGVEAVGVFIEGLNRFLEQNGIYDTHFVTPDGYFHDEHYTTLDDMAAIAILASQNEIITKYGATREDSVVYASGHSITWKNTNALIDPYGPYYNPYVTGLKTGAAGSGNYSLVCTAEKDGQKYIVGIFGALNSDVRFSDAKRIVEQLCGTAA